MQQEVTTPMISYFAEQQRIEEQQRIAATRPNEIVREVRGALQDEFETFRRDLARRTMRTHIDAEFFHNEQQNQSKRSRDMEHLQECMDWTRQASR
jgi:hypothetical protein